LVILGLLTPSTFCNALLYDLRLVKLINELVTKSSKFVYFLMNFDWTKFLARKKARITPNRSSTINQIGEGIITKFTIVARIIKPPTIYDGIKDFLEMNPARVIPEKAPIEWAIITNIILPFGMRSIFCFKDSASIGSMLSGNGKKFHPSCSIK
jgi:hypothetical protein